MHVTRVSRKQVKKKNSGMKNKRIKKKGSMKLTYTCTHELLGIKKKKKKAKKKKNSIHAKKKKKRK